MIVFEHNPVSLRAHNPVPVGFGPRIIAPACNSFHASGIYVLALMKFSRKTQDSFWERFLFCSRQM